MGQRKPRRVDTWPTNQNLLRRRLARYVELRGAFGVWLSKQSLAVEATLEAAMSAARGATLAIAFLYDDPYALSNPHAMASLKLKQPQPLSGGLMIQARNFAVLTGLNSGISCVMKRLRGKEDVQSIMVAAFVSGATFSLLSDMSRCNQVVNAASSGLIFALTMGGHFQLGQMFSQPPTKETFYSKTRSLLSNLGLQSYEKNFRKGLLTDSTLPLLTDSALRDVKIPLLILDQIQKETEVKGRSGK